ncbi:hypothetical protein FISHEDRAFT_70072 [Fistulina hepatica ATCC 64428]|uniref:DUF6532 domain-containing protein n=1 Tax=Fistulina hepatica ATCC 64428 TaxID=1128425 RepID=A0A0D7AK20_9AGAR|nr:hypothetical protein FISHEDRAFT_70072 [Fistulina hepatica ATCC 64428]
MEQERQAEAPLPDASSVGDKRGRADTVSAPRPQGPKCPHAGTANKSADMTPLLGASDIVPQVLTPMIPMPPSRDVATLSPSQPLIMPSLTSETQTGLQTPQAMQSAQPLMPPVHAITYLTIPDPTSRSRPLSPAPQDEEFPQPHQLLVPGQCGRSQLALPMSPNEINPAGTTAATPLPVPELAPQQQLPTSIPQRDEQPRSALPPHQGSQQRSQNKPQHVDNVEDNVSQQGGDDGSESNEDPKSPGSSESQSDNDDEDDHSESEHGAASDNGIDIIEPKRRKLKSKMKGKGRRASGRYTGKPKQTDFPHKYFGLLERAHMQLCLEVACNCPFPEEKEDFAEHAILNAIEGDKQLTRYWNKIGKDDEMKQWMLKYISASLGDVHGYFKTAAMALISGHFHLDLLPFTDKDRVASESAGRLDETKEWQYDKSQALPWMNLIIHVMIRKVILSMKGQSVACIRKELEQSEQVPGSLITLASAAVESALLEWQSGTRQPLEFSEQRSWEWWLELSQQWSRLQEQATGYVEKVCKYTFWDALGKPRPSAEQQADASTSTPARPVDYSNLANVDF